MCDYKLIGMRTPEQYRCVFCRELVSGTSNAPWDKPVSETDKYLIVPTKGSLVPGWLLVVSKDHMVCAGELRSPEFRDLEHAIDIAKGIVEQNFGPATVFEHGPALAGTALGCGIDHLHIHVAPLGFSLAESVEFIIPDVFWQSLRTFSQLRALHTAGLGYALIGEPKEEMKWFQPPTGLRQPLRRAIATKLGFPERFDYAAYPHVDNVIRTLEGISIGM
jgi:ATP adenylyltransferase